MPGTAPSGKDNSMSIAFTKLHGLGNDYLFIETEKRPIADPAELSRRMSHRHLGVGSDGIILVMPGEQAEFKMRIFNADGSEAETCGNGIRCFAKYVYERKITDKTEFTIETLAGPNRVSLSTEAGKVLTVRSNMGRPRFDRAEIPMLGAPGRVLEEELDLGGGEVVKITCPTSAIRMRSSSSTTPRRSPWPRSARKLNITPSSRSAQT